MENINDLEFDPDLTPEEILRRVRIIDERIRWNEALINRIKKYYPLISDFKLIEKPPTDRLN